MALLFLLTQPGLWQIVYALLLERSILTSNRYPRSVKDNSQVGVIRKHVNMLRVCKGACTRHHFISIHTY